MGRIVTRTGPIDPCSNPATGGPNSGILASDEAIENDHDNANCRPRDYICDVSYIDDFRVQSGLKTNKTRLRLLGLLLMLQTDLLWSHVAAYANDCRRNQFYDPHRLLCLDCCGRDNELICPLEDFCSSNQLWSEHFDPPICLNRCIHACDKTSYCDHDSALCRPCDTLCDDSNVDACRAYCYDVYITLPTAAPKPPWETCSAYRYYDFNRKVCLDRCGADNEGKCGADQFCSTTVAWGVKIHPPRCLNHCPHPCDDATYCDSISHQCLSCQDLCGDTNTDRCRIHCYDVFINVTSLEPQTTEDSAPITPANNTGLSTDILSAVIVYQVILGVLSATIVVLVCVLAIKHCRQSRSRNTSDDSHDSENNGTTSALMKASPSYISNHACEEHRDV